MIKEKDVEINITHRNKSQYKKYNIVKLNCKYLIDIRDINKNSKVKITAICDICEEERILSVQKYYKNYDKYEIYTCLKCSNIKNKMTNLEKYGVEYPLQNIEILNKQKSTNLEKYGVENVFQLDSIKEKIKKTCLEKYGVEHHLQSKDILNKQENTNLERHGVKRPSQNNIIFNKICETKKKRYNNPYYTNKIKSNKTIFDLYGVKNVSQIPTHKEKIQLYYHKYIKNKYPFIVDVNYNDKNYICLCDKGHNYKIDINLFHNRLQHNITLCMICNPFNSLNSSKELQLLDFIKENYNGTIIENDRKILNGKEIDILLPNVGIGFEFNGDYWHSKKFKKNGYHFNKIRNAYKKNIKLYNIWEHKWDNNRKEIENKIIKLLDDKRKGSRN